MIVETEEYKGHKINIQPDEDPQNPRTEWDNLGTMVMFHGRYDLGDKDHGYDKNDYSSWNELQKAILRKENVAVILPVFMYDHSGIALKVGSFQGLLPQGHAEFDSGQVGFIFISKEKAREEYGWKQITAKRKEQLVKYLTGEVETYGDYVNGSVYGFTIENEDGEEIEEPSLWGFYGYDHEKSGLMQCAKNVIDDEIEAASKPEKDPNQMELELA